MLSMHPFTSGCKRADGQFGACGWVFGGSVLDRVTKDFPVFDCDAHVNDPLQIWEYVPDADRELVRSTYWRDDSTGWLNGSRRVMGGGMAEWTPMYNPMIIAGPQMNKKIMRRLLGMVPLADEQREYLAHQGAFDPHERIKDLDLMGIDQVLVIPTAMLANFPFAENHDGARAFCRAYNDWARDWCSEEQDRLFPAAMLPIQDADYAAEEIRRIAGLGFPVGLIRPFDARGDYPNRVGTPLGDVFGKWTSSLDPVFRAFEETGVCLGMHTFPAGVQGRTAGPGLLASPGEFLSHAGVDYQTLSFIFEAQTWLAQVLLSGFLDRYRDLKMLIFESNSSWITYVLDACDRLFKLYRREREVSAERLPSEAFFDQCAFSFESDEALTFRQWEMFRAHGLWASDAYHHDGADVWSAIREMTDCGVPKEAQVELLGGNARRLYGIEGKLFVTEEPPPIKRPDWFPQGPEFEEWAELIKDPRKNAAALQSKGFENPLKAALQGLVG